MKEAEVASRGPPRRLVRRTSARASSSAEDAANLFRRLDSDKSGRLTPDKIRNGLAERGLPCSPRDLRLFFARADLDGDGLIDEHEFRTFAAVQEGSVRAAFEAIDADKDGRITTAEVKLAARTLGFRLSAEQVRTLMTRLDGDGDGAVTYEELTSFLLLLPAANPAAIYEACAHMLVVDHAQSECTPPPEVHFEAGPDGRPPSLASQLASKLYAGGIAGAASRTLTAPIDRLKMVLQVGSTEGGMGGAARAIWAEGGARAFFRGNGANVLKIAPETAGKFVAFERLKGLVAADPANVSVPERFVAGGAAGALAQAAIYPLEIAKTRLAVSAPGTYDSVLGCLRAVGAAEGARALYRGLGTSVVGIVPYAGIDLTVNSLLKERLAGWYASRGQEPGVPAVLACGMASSAFAMGATYPLNLVRTRLQASGMPGSPAFDGPFDCLRRTLAAGGVRALYRGIVPNLLKVLPATSISYAVYDRLSGTGL